MNKVIFPTLVLILLATNSSNAAIENLDEMDARKSRRASNTYYSGEAPGNGWNRQPETLMYYDTRTGNEVWVLSNTPNKSNIFYTDISPANPWSADGARLGFFSNRKVSEFSRTYGSNLDGGGAASSFTVNTDGSHLRAAYDSSERSWGTNASQFFYWNPSLPDVYYTLGGRLNGISLDASAIYKNIVTDTGTTFSKLVDLPGTDTDYYAMKKIISPDGQYLLPKKGGKIFPVRVHPEASATLTDPDGWDEYRGQTTQFGGGDPFACRHDIYFPSPRFIVLLYSTDCNPGEPVFYKLNIGGTAPDGGPAFNPDEKTYATFGRFETEPLWNTTGTRVPWKLEPTNSKHWWGHPGFDRWGRTVTFGDGNGYHLINGTRYEWGGPVTWDYKARKMEAQPSGDTYPIVNSTNAASYNDHNAWSDYFAMGSGGTQADPLSSWIGTTRYDKVHYENDFRFVAYHYDNTNASTSYNYTSNCRVAQSPDGTKISYAITYFTDVPNTGDLAFAVAYNPHPPEITSVTNNSGSYTVRFDWRLKTATPRGYTKRGWPDEATDTPPPPRETKLFRVWRTCAKIDDWKPLGTVNADIFSRYDFSTGQWKGNDYWEFTDDSKPSGTCYYAVTAQEHSGLESRTLSNVLSTTGTQTAEYPSDPKGAKPFYLVAPQWPKPTVSKLSTPGQYRLDWEEPANALIRYYNIYYSTNPIPKAIQSQRIASVPKGTNTYVDWLAHPTSEGHYLITSVDSQGNESSLARRMLTP